MFGAIWPGTRVPTGECCEEDKGQEGEDDGDDEEVWEDNGVLKSTGHPYQVERVLINADQICKGGRILVAHPCAAIGLDTYAKVSNSYSEIGLIHNVGDGSRNPWVDLDCTENRRVLLVVQGDEIDVGYQRGGR